MLHTRIDCQVVYVTCNVGCIWLYMTLIHHTVRFSGHAHTCDAASLQLSCVLGTTYLLRAGLKLLNLSLDTLKPERFERMTRRRGHDRVLETLQLALSLGFDPVKVCLWHTECTRLCAKVHTVHMHTRLTGFPVHQGVLLKPILNKSMSLFMRTSSQVADSIMTGRACHAPTVSAALLLLIFTAGDRAYAVLQSWMTAHSASLLPC